MSSINRVRLAALAGTLLAFSGHVATAKTVLFPKLKSSSVLVVDQSDQTVLY